MIKTITTNADGMIVMTKDEFDRILEEAYVDGTKDQFLFDQRNAIGTRTPAPAEVE